MSIIKSLSLEHKITWLIMLLISFLLIGGALLRYNGNDAVIIAMNKKSGILTAEQIQVSFNSVKGRIIQEMVKEGDEVKKGDILMKLDGTDIDFNIAKIQTQIAQLDAQIQAKQPAITLGLERADIQSAQIHRDIDRQKAAIKRVESMFQNKLTEYNRKIELFQADAISQSEMDLAQNDLNVAQANVVEEKEKLEQLLAGARDNENSDLIELPNVIAMRQEVLDQKFIIEELFQRKNQLSVELEQLKIQKE